MERQSSKFGLRTVAIVGGGACKFRDFVFQARVFGCAVLDAVLVVLDAVLVVLEAVLVGNGQPPSHGVGHGAEVVGVGTVGTVGTIGTIVPCLHHWPFRSPHCKTPAQIPRGRFPYQE